MPSRSSPQLRPSAPPVDRAALYLRMSTENQTYSLDHQRHALQTYADAHGLQVVHAYADPARSGLRADRRPGLRSLIADVLEGPDFGVVLVYDISRWGRFQDSDEAAYYEFLCRANGVAIRYCAEGFQGESGVGASLMKALKRVMAAEYSRELSVKVSAGHERLFQLGFRQGAPAVLGLRRVLVDAERRPKGELAYGERKSLHSDRVVLQLGPEPEQELVRSIFRMRVVEDLPVAAIARRLNGQGVHTVRGRPWRADAVTTTLRNPLYIGVACFGRTTQRLGARRRCAPLHAQLRLEGVVPPLVDRELFTRAQTLLDRSPRPNTREDMLQALRCLLAAHGALSSRLIDAAPEAPSASAIGRRFGSLRAAYALVGYIPARRAPATAAPDHPRSSSS